MKVFIVTIILGAAVYFGVYAYDNSFDHLTPTRTIDPNGNHVWMCSVSNGLFMPPLRVYGSGEMDTLNACRMYKEGK